MEFFRRRVTLAVDLIGSRFVMHKRSCLGLRFRLSVEIFRWSVQPALVAPEGRRSFAAFGRVFGRSCPAVCAGSAGAHERARRAFMVFATGDVPGQRCTHGEAIALQSLAGPSVCCLCVYYW